jgi:hypothetical protein
MIAPVAAPTPAASPIPLPVPGALRPQSHAAAAPPAAIATPPGSQDRGTRGLAGGAGVGHTRGDSRVDGLSSPQEGR